MDFLVHLLHEIVYPSSVGSSFSNRDVLLDIASSLRVSQEPDIWKTLQPLFQFLFGLISTGFGAFIGYRSARSHDKRKFIRDSHVAFLKSVNEFLFGINVLITNIKKIDKLGFTLLQERYPNHAILPAADFNMASLKIRTLVAFLDSNMRVQSTGAYTSREHYFTEIHKAAEQVLDFNVIIQLGATLQKESVNYLYLIDPIFKTMTDRLVDELALASVENMVGFDLDGYKIRCVELVMKINEKIVKMK